MPTNLIWLFILVLLILILLGILWQTDYFKLIYHKLTRGMGENMALETWDTYDWKKHEKEHYDPEKGNRSYGLIIFSDDKVLMVQNREKMWGFPKGHREDQETPFKAATREVYEETGIKIPANTDLKAVSSGEVSMEYKLNLNEEKLNKHIQKQISRNERPHWNKPGEIPTKIIFFVIDFDKIKPFTESTPKPIIQEAGIADGTLDAQWIPVDQASDLILNSKSNQNVIFEEALAKYKKN